MMRRFSTLLLLMAVLFCNAQSLRYSSNILIGKIDQNGTVRDSNNKMIGKYESDGDVRDRNNMHIGRVKSDGTVVDRNNMTIGYAKDIPKAYAAVFFFFNMFER